jgi:hypothetical protein
MMTTARTANRIFLLFDDGAREARPGVGAFPLPATGGAGNTFTLSSLGVIVVALEHVAALLFGKFQGWDVVMIPVSTRPVPPQLMLSAWDARRKNGSRFPAS